MRLGLFGSTVLAGIVLLTAEDAARQQDPCSENIPSVDEHSANCAAVAQVGQEIRSQAAAFNNGGNARAAKGDNDRAIADYNEAIRLDPNYTHAYFNRGLAYAAKGDNDSPNA